MATLPCCMCGERFIGPAIVGYHRWYTAGWRKAYKQKLCFKCSKIHFGPIQAGAVDADADEPEWPKECPGCKTPLEGDIEETYSVWYRGKVKRNTVLIQCHDCAANVRTIMLQGADELSERSLAGGAEGGSPLRNPPGWGEGTNLPW